MEARYYSEVRCRFDATRSQIEAWVDRCTDIGDRFGDEVGLFDVDFSVDLGRLEIGIHAAHILRPRHDDADDELLNRWVEGFRAVGHATGMLKYVDAADHLQYTEFVLVQGVGEERQELVTFAVDWRPPRLHADGDLGD